MRCNNCSAPIPPGKTICTYCGSGQDVDLQGRKYYTTHAPKEKRLCCNCAKPMVTINIETEDHPFLIEQCEDCKGLFFDFGEIDAFIDQSIRNVFTVDLLGIYELQQQNRLGEVKYRKCPVCQNLMNRVNFGKSSGVIVDQCIDHGMYLDAGELRQIMLWVRKGGQILAKQNQEQITPSKRKPASEMLFKETQQDTHYSPTLDIIFSKILDLIK